MSGNPNWKTGGPSPNAGGRPKVQSDAAKQLARMIHEELRGGAELVEFAVAVYRHPVGPVAVAAGIPSGGALHGMVEITAEDKHRMHVWLSERGFGKPLQSIDLTGEVAMPAIDLSKLSGMTDEQLAAADQVLAEVERTVGG